MVADCQIVQNCPKIIKILSEAKTVRFSNKRNCLKKAGFTKIIDNCVIFKVGTDIDVLQSAFRLSKLMKIIHLICNNFLNAMLTQNWNLKDARAGADREGKNLVPREWDSTR